MIIFRDYKILSFIALIIAVLGCFSPVLADNTSVSIAYRGAGGNYIGDTIIFDGYNSVSNMTVLKLTGPGLPALGVPVYDLNGPAGSGNPVEVNPDGSWRFVWYTGNIKDVEQMQTARYYITAFDLSDPSKTATTSIMMKKPDFYVVASPDKLETGDYVQLLGTAEVGTPDIRIEIRNMSGSILHVYNTAATETGYFNYGFHIDMPPGDYSVTISSPTVKSSFQTTIHVIPPPAPVPSSASEAGQPGITLVSTPVMSSGFTTTPASVGTTVTPATAAPNHPGPFSISPLAIIACLIIAALVVFFILVIGKKI